CCTRARTRRRERPRLPRSTSPTSARASREENLAAGSLQHGIHLRALAARERGVALAQRAQAFALVRERVLHPRLPVDRALDARLLLLERARVREQERRVHTPDLGKERAQALRRVARGEPAFVVVADGEPREILDAVDPRADARRLRARD